MSARPTGEDVDIPIDEEPPRTGPSDVAPTGSTEFSESERGTGTGKKKSFGLRVPDDEVGIPSELPGANERVTPGKSPKFARTMPSANTASPALSPPAGEVRPRQDTLPLHGGGGGTAGNGNANGNTHPTSVMSGSIQGVANHSPVAVQTSQVPMPSVPPAQRASAPPSSTNPFQTAPLQVEKPEKKLSTQTPPMGVQTVVSADAQMKSKELAQKEQSAEVLARLNQSERKLSKATPAAAFPPGFHSLLRTDSLPPPKPSIAPTPAAGIATKVPVAGQASFIQQLATQPEPVPPPARPEPPRASVPAARQSSPALNNDLTPQRGVDVPVAVSAAPPITAVPQVTAAPPVHAAPPPQREKADSVEIPIDEDIPVHFPESGKEFAAEASSPEMDPATEKDPHAEARAAQTAPSRVDSVPNPVQALSPATHVSHAVPAAIPVGMSSSPNVADAIRPRSGVVNVAPGQSPIAPAPVSEAQKKKTRAWWEDFFNDEYLRATPVLPEKVFLQEVDFVEESLGVERGSTVLDLACGPGRFSVELSRRGYNVVGFDLSLAMLAKASETAQDRGQKVNFVQGDMREMTFDGVFDGVFCWNTSFGYFEDEKNQQVIARVHRALKPGGQFLLDIVNRDYVIRESPSLVWFEGDHCVCMDEMHMDWISSRVRVKRTMMFDEGRPKEIEYSFRAYSLHELGKILHDQGFKVAEVSGNLATPGVFFGSDSKRCIVLAEKR
ncbi:MAG: methyltransferase domain-containing protein [Polyangiaceae bacterium]|nr:methyltransferase domain-containing protein [Polyangiaceae bacterium]